MLTDKIRRPRKVNTAIATVLSLVALLGITNPSAEDFVDWGGEIIVKSIQENGCVGDRRGFDPLYDACVEEASRGRRYLTSFAQRQIRIRQTRESYIFWSNHHVKIDNAELRAIGIGGFFIRLD